jgi:hypothetical protein
MLKTALALVSAVAISVPAWADHAWSNYHWARTTTSFDLTIVNSTTSDWDGYVSAAITDPTMPDWSDADSLNVVEDPDGPTSSRVRRKCQGPSGKIRICNLAYGFNGWLGIAGISVDADGHITTGYTKLNDSYFSADYYNTDGWKQSVACQELGHNIGLGHQDENFDNESLLSCMDYQDPPYAYPNYHDYQELASIYAHRDTTDSYSGGSDSGGDSGGVCNAPPGKGCNKSGLPDSNRDIGWGVSMGRRGHSEMFMRIDPDGTRHITHVLWVDGHDDEHSH